MIFKSNPKALKQPPVNTTIFAYILQTRKSYLIFSDNSQFTNLHPQLVSQRTFRCCCLCFKTMSQRSHIIYSSVRRPVHPAVCPSILSESLLIMLMIKAGIYIIITSSIGGSHFFDITFIIIIISNSISISIVPMNLVIIVTSFCS